MCSAARLCLFVFVRVCSCPFVVRFVCCSARDCIAAQRPSLSAIPSPTVVHNSGARFFFSLMFGFHCKVAEWKRAYEELATSGVLSAEAEAADGREVGL